MTTLVDDLVPDQLWALLAPLLPAPPGLAAAGTPGPGKGRRRSLRQWRPTVAARYQPQIGRPIVVDRHHWRGG